MRVPGTINKHSPEHQTHVCRFLDISVEEYEDWLTCYNLDLWRKFSNFLMDLREKINKSTTSMEPISITLDESIRLYGMEGRVLTTAQQKILVESTNALLKSHDLNWFLENNDSLTAALEKAFGEL